MTHKLPDGAIHALPKDFHSALTSDKKVESLWLGITPLARNEWICWIEDAKKSETRTRRITASLDKMRKGMLRPCCWAGCSHR